MYYFNIILTEICNANCSHCYMSSSKSKRKSLTFNQINELVDKLPNNVDGITLTGGEVFTVYELLEYAIKKIREKFITTKIEIESNGMYIYKGDTVNILRKLKLLGVDSLRFSLDPFHAEGGLDLDRVRNIKKYENDDTPIIRFLEQKKAVAFGKAKKLNRDLIENKNCMNSIKSKNKPYLFLDIKGDIYLCPWKISPSIGNIFKDDFKNIIKKLEEPLYSNILVGNILEACNTVKNDNNKKIIEQLGECYLCEKIFKGE